MVDGLFQQTLAAIAATFFIICDGMHYSWSAPMVPKLRAPTSPISNISDTDVSLLESVYLIGGAFGLPLISYFADKIGRKRCIQASILINLSSWIIIALVPKVWALWTARFFAGMTADMGYVCIPMYVAEVSHQKVRGLFTGFVYFGITFGFLLMYSIGPFLTIPITSCFGIGINLIALALISPMPESPYYFIKKNRKDDAEKSLKYLRGNTDVSDEIREIHEAVLRQESEKGSFSDLVKDKGNLKAMLIMTVVFSSSNLVGMTVIIMNVNEILSKTHNVLSPELSSVLCALTMLIAIAVAVCVVDKLGRIFLLCTSSIITGISLVLLATCLYVESNGADYKALEWLPLFSVLLYSASMRLGIGFVPLVLNGELYSTKVKAKGMVYGDLVYILSGCLSVYLYQELREDFGTFAPLYLFAAWSFATAIFTFLYIPETKGKTLEEIQIILKGGNKCNKKPLDE